MPIETTAETEKQSRQGLPSSHDVDVTMLSEKSPEEISLEIGHFIDNTWKDYDNYA